MILDELNALKNQTDGCTMVSLADLSSGMILSTSADSGMSRDQLNALSTQAATLLPKDGSTVFGAAPAQSVLVASGDSVRVFMRSAAVPTDAICAICAKDTDFTAFLAGAAGCLSKISKDA